MHDDDECGYVLSFFGALKCSFFGHFGGRIPAYSTHTRYYYYCPECVWCLERLVFLCHYVCAYSITARWLAGWLLYDAATWHHIACNKDECEWLRDIFMMNKSRFACARAHASITISRSTFVYYRINACILAHKTHIFVIICINTAWERRREKKTRTKSRRHKNTEANENKKKLNATRMRLCVIELYYVIRNLVRQAWKPWKQHYLYIYIEASSSLSVPHSADQNTQSHTGCGQRRGSFAGDIVTCACAVWILLLSYLGWCVRVCVAMHA